MKTIVTSLQRVVHFVLICISPTFHSAQAQMRVGQPTSAPDASAALDVSGGPYPNGSLYRGFLPPKVALISTTQANPITTPAVGLMVYNTASTSDVTPGYYYWENNKWMRFGTPSDAGSARVAASGDPIPAYTFREAKALTTAPSPLFMLTEPGQEGLFRNANAPTSSRDTISANGIRDASGNISSSGTVMTVAGQRYKRVINDGTINVKWFGAVGQGDATNDAPAIQQAVNYAKSLLNTYGTLSNIGAVLIPPGYYRILKTIDVTRTNGLVIRGSGGRFNGSVLVGNTQGVMLDFTGSSLSGCENLAIHSYASESGASTIGIQFALNSDQSPGGLQCTVRNCHIMMADIPSANNNVGTIGIVNCQAEEFAVTDCLIQANIGCIFTYKSSLNDVGIAYTISSAYTTVATQGSMGVVNFSGQNSIYTFGKGQPALVLNGTNSVNFHGYFGRASYTGSGSNEAAVLISGPATYNANISGTVESFAQLLRVKGPLFNSTINAVVANQVNSTSTFPAGTTRHPVIDVSGAALIRGCKFSITFGNGQSEIGNRYLLYDNGQNTAQLLNNEIICSEWANNNYVVSPNLLSYAQNTTFKTLQPFERKSLSINAVINSQNISTAGWAVGTYYQIVPTGTLSNSSVYVMKLIWGQNGVDQIVQSYVFPMSGTDFNGNSAAQVLPTLTPTTISWSNAGRSINVRYKAPTTSGQTSYGLEATVNKSDMSNGTLTITVSPLL